MHTEAKTRRPCPNQQDCHFPLAQQEGTKQHERQ